MIEGVEAQVCTLHAIKENEDCWDRNHEEAKGKRKEVATYDE